MRESGKRGEKRGRREGKKKKREVREIEERGGKKIRER